MRTDLYSRTEAQAAEFERRYGPEHPDDRPSLSDLYDGPRYLDEEELDELGGEPPCTDCPRPHRGPC
jgi:hypothetical protein